MKRACTLHVVFAAAVTLLVITAAPAFAQDNPPHYVGPQACQKCHAEEWDSYQTNPHHLAEIDGKVVADHVGCEACHGPGSRHVEADGKEDDPGFAMIRNLRRMKPAEASAICQTCHKTGAQFYWDQSNHARNDVRCMDCHSIHAAKSQAQTALLTKSKTSDLCVTCHRDKRSALEHTAHMPLREGSMSCVDCHNPHGSEGPHMIRAASNVDLCVSCHTDKRGPFLWEHPPVREKCVTCYVSDSTTL